ncbi:PAS domain S-box protein [Pseudomonas sp. R2.Fl]|nr:PAS domain S-box protein [Pseudomonas sp. R2.Fl]
MPAKQYPFIDIAVHGTVRDRFARGEALVLFSADMQNVLWANGAGAAHFGNPSVYDFLEQGPNHSELSFRQLAATAGQLSAVGDARSVVVRVASGFRSVPMQAQVELTEIRQGERAVLFCLPTSSRLPSSDELARRMLSGFDDPDTHMAVLNDEGTVIAASPGFKDLGIVASSMRGFITMVDNEAGHLLKRPLSTGRGYLPAAIGKVSDAPVMYLMLAVETILGNFGPAEEPETGEQEEAAVEQPAVEEAPAEAGTTADADVPTEDVTAADIGTDITDEPTFMSDAPTESDIDAAQPAASFEAEAEAETAAPDAFEAEAAPETVETDIDEPTAVGEAPAEAVEPATASEPAEPSAFSFEPTSRATRFVWKIDADGRFTEVSHEFAAAVGPRAAAIEGVAFVDLAALFNLDPDGKIVELLSKRDTWSGKTIYWPVEGTSLRVPVDLAALPTYTRSREFDGFRGFGVVRLADAIEDPLASGLALGESPELVEDATAEEPVAATDAIPEVETDVPDILAEADAMTAQANLTAAGTATIDEHAAEQVEEIEQTPESPRDEPPAIIVTETPVHRATDKIIQLDDRRLRSREGLSASEEAAFREIARKLDPIGPRAADTDATMEQPAIESDAKAAAPETPAEAPRAAEPPVFRTATPAPASFSTQRRDIGLGPEIVDLMPVPLLVHVADRLIHGNPEFLKLTGYDNLEALAEAGGLDALLQREDLDEAEGRASRMVVVRADDTLVPVTAKLQSIRWEQASALMLSLVPSETAETATDQPSLPTDEQASELSRLRVEADEMRSILETATDGVVIIGTDGEIRSMNRSASALFNYDGEELRGKPFVMLFAHESQKAILDYLGGLAGHGVASVLNDGREVIGREASGGFLPLFMTIGKLTSSNGYCAVIRDITQWKRTEEELRSAKRAAETANAHKSEFLARVSHEIRTPLNAIIGFADIMASEHFGPVGHARYAEYASDIVRSGRHVLDIVNDLLDISKIEAGEMDLDFTAVGLNETVSQAVAIVQPQANSQRVIIRTALSQAVPNVVADLRSIKQIVLNILANAIRFTPSGGQIIVSTAYETNGSVVLRIRDTGIGMTRSELEQAMKPFRQVSPGTRPRGDGTGLGLPLTKAMVDANRANFSISSAPNEGTLVEITFPSPRVLAD